MARTRISTELAEGMRIAILLLGIVLAACVPAGPEAANDRIQIPRTLAEYQQGIDYSCSRDADCAIKDVHNCCGYYPRCVNRDSEVNPALVNKLCEKESSVGVCGFPAISGCACVSGRCAPA